LIVGLNGKRINNSLSSYCAAAAGLQSGQQATFTVMDVTNSSHPGKAERLTLRIP